MDWPPIQDERLASRLSMDEAEFTALSRKLARRIEAREFSDSDYERACAYPWERPEHSFWMEDGSVELLDWGTRPHAGREQRYPLITFGSNGAPGVLAEKLAVLPEDERDVLALAGTLRGFKVAPSAHLAIYGALPATIVRDEQGETRAGLLMVTAEQFEVLTRTEFNYVLARIDGAAFLPDLDVAPPESIFAYVSRWGVFAPDGVAQASQASQAALLDRAAELVIDVHADGRGLVHRVFSNYAWAVETAQPRLAEHAAPFVAAEWELFSTRP